MSDYNAGKWHAARPEWYSADQPAYVKEAVAARYVSSSVRQCLRIMKFENERGRKGQEIAHARIR